MRKWDIYLANVPFEDLPESKVRPVLVLDDCNIFILCLKMTSQNPRKGEYVLMDWEEAGLRKQTTVRISKLLKLNRKEFINKIGSLSLRDIQNIRNLMN